MSTRDSNQARARRNRVFERHERAARDGIHLPSLGELVMSMTFLRGDLQADAVEFANRVMTKLHPQTIETRELWPVLQTLSITPSLEDFLSASKVFSNLPITRRLRHDFMLECRLRCDFYAACLGDHESMLRISCYAMCQARRYSTPADVAYDGLLSAMGWLELAANRGFDPGSNHPHVAVIGATILDELVLTRDKHPDPGTRKSTETIFALDRSASNANLDPAAAVPTKPAQTDGVVVLPSIGNVDIHQGSGIKQEFASILGIALPLTALPDLNLVQRKLRAEFPHLAPLVTKILSNLRPERSLKLRPTLLIGPSGSGKTTFARRLLEELGVKNEIYPCGGADDSSFGGTARRWASGEPSVPVSLVRKYMTASPGVILDELDKVGMGRNNGSLHDCLLALLEPQSSTSWRDPYLQAPVDLSRVIWIATANSRTTIPRSLRDRFDHYTFLPPTHMHLLPLATAIMKHIYASRGHDPRWSLPLDGEELEALITNWTDQSIRTLQRLVHVLVDTRDKNSRIQ